MRKSRTVGVVLGLVASMFLVAPAAATPRTYPTCNLPESDAEALQILNAVYPNRYVWDDADITVAVRGRRMSTRNMWTRHRMRSPLGPM